MPCNNIGESENIYPATGGDVYISVKKDEFCTDSNISWNGWAYGINGNFDSNSNPQKYKINKNYSINSKNGILKIEASASSGGKCKGKNLICQQEIIQEGLKGIDINVNIPMHIDFPIDGGERNFDVLIKSEGKDITNLYNSEDIDLEFEKVPDWIKFEKSNNGIKIKLIVEENTTYQRRSLENIRLKISVKKYAKDYFTGSTTNSIEISQDSLKLFHATMFFIENEEHYYDLSWESQMYLEPGMCTLKNTIKGQIELVGESGSVDGIYYGQNFSLDDIDLIISGLAENIKIVFDDYFSKIGYNKNDYEEIDSEYLVGAYIKRINPFFIIGGLYNNKGEKVNTASYEKTDGEYKLKIESFNPISVTGCSISASTLNDSFVTFNNGTHNLTANGVTIGETFPINLTENKSYVNGRNTSIYITGSTNGTYSKFYGNLSIHQGLRKQNEIDYSLSISPETVGPESGKTSQINLGIQDDVKWKMEIEEKYGWIGFDNVETRTISGIGSYVINLALSENLTDEEREAIISFITFDNAGYNMPYKNEVSANTSLFQEKYVSTIAEISYSQYFSCSTSSVTPEPDINFRWGSSLKEYEYIKFPVNPNKGYIEEIDSVGKIKQTVLNVGNNGKLFLCSADTESFSNSAKTYVSVWKTINGNKIEPAVAQGFIKNLFEIGDKGFQLPASYILKPKEDLGKKVLFEVCYDSEKKDEIRLAIDIVYDDDSGSSNIQTKILLDKVSDGTIYVRPYVLNVYAMDENDIKDVIYKKLIFNGFDKKLGIPYIKETEEKEYSGTTSTIVLSSGFTTYYDKEKKEEGRFDWNINTRDFGFYISGTEDDTKNWVSILLSFTPLDDESGYSLFDGMYQYWKLDDIGKEVAVWTKTQISKDEFDDLIKETN